MVTSGHIPLALVAGLAMAGVGEGGVVRLAGGAVPARLTVLLAKVLLHLAVHALREVRLRSFRLKSKEIHLIDSLYPDLP